MTTNYAYRLFQLSDKKCNIFFITDVSTSTTGNGNRLKFSLLLEYDKTYHVIYF